MKKQLSGPIIAIVIVVVVAVAGILLYRAATGGIQGDGKEGNIQASMPGERKGPPVAPPRPPKDGS